MQAGSTPLHECAFNDFEEAADLLLAGGCKWDECNMVSIPYAQGEDSTNAPYSKHYDACVQGGRTPLHLSTEQGAISIAKKLLELGADGDRQDRDGETPFLNATDSCKKLLVQFGFKGDLSTTSEARDAAFMANLDDRGGTKSAAQAALGPQGALKTDGLDEKSGLLSVKIEKKGEEFNFYIQRARYLKDCDAMGKNDVYVVVSVGIEDLKAGIDNMQHQRTSVLKDAGADPVWNGGNGEKLTFLDVPTDYSDIYFRVYDEDMGGEMNHDLIGIHKINVTKVAKLRGDGMSDYVWEADVQLRTNKAEEANLPPATSDRYRSAEELDESGNPLAGGVAAT